MKKRNLGQTGTLISSIGIGAMSFSDAYGKTDTKQSHNLLSSAIDFGINHIDTSDIYGMGESEERIGTFLRNNRSTKSFFKIATKGGIERGKNGKTRFNNSKIYLKNALESSLKRLGVDHIELYYIHRRDINYEIEEVTETLVEFIREGKIGQIGFSEISPNSLAKASTIHSIGAVQSEYSLSTRYPELGLVQKLKELNSSLVAFSPLGRSLLTDKPHSFHKAQTFKFLKANPRFLEPNLSQNINAANGFRNLASDFGISAAGLAIAWLLKKQRNIIPIPGTRSSKHLESIVNGANYSLTKLDMIDIEKTLPLGWAYGDRYSIDQWIGPEKYC